MRDATRRLSDLVEQARRHGVRDEAVLKAIGLVPRQEFVPRRFAAAAYDDGPLPIGEGQTISQPAMVAMMAEAARLNPHDCVLEVGAGSGYGALVLRTLAGRVVTIERRPALAEKARAALARAGNRLGDVTVVVGDGTLGWPDEAPFDAIVVTAAGPAPPPPLLKQLAPGGRLVMPIGPRHGHQHLMRYTRRGRSDTHSGGNGAPGEERLTGDAPRMRERSDGAPGEEYREERLTPVRFVPLLGAHGFPGRK